MLPELLPQLSNVLYPRWRRLRLRLASGSREIRVSVRPEQRESLLESHEADGATESGNGDRQGTTLLLLRLRMMRKGRGLWWLLLRLRLRRHGGWLLRRVLLLVLLLLLRLLGLRLLLRLLRLLDRGGSRCCGSR